MKNWFPLACGLVICLLPSTAPGSGSLAARVQAAKDAKEAATQAVEMAMKTPPPVAQAPAATKPTTSGRINVADWLNGDTNSTAQSQPNQPAQDLDAGESASAEARGTGEPGASAPILLSRRRNFSYPPSSTTPAPAPPTTASTTVAAEVAQPTSKTSEGAAEEISDDLHPDSMTLDPAHPAATSTSEAASASSAARNVVPSTNERQAEKSALNQTPPSAVTEKQRAVASAETTRPREDVQQSPSESQSGHAQTGAKESQDASKVSSQKTPLQDIAPLQPKKQLSPQMLRLRDQIRSCLAYYYQRPESSTGRSPWGVMHAMIAYGVDAELVAGRQHVNAIGWLCYNRPCRGMKLLSFDGRYPVPRLGPGYQGHEGQLLSMLALSRVKSTYPMLVDGHKLTVQDLIEYEKISCRPKTELTFKLVGLAHYLPSDAKWTSKWGQPWSIPRLIQEELAQPINGACCGGTHRLIGYSMALRVRQKRDEPIDGQWLRAQKYVDSYHKYVIKLQNRDGSFSTDWLKRRAGSSDIDRRIQTTGHVLEWLVFSLPEQELTDPRIVRAVSYLNTAMINNRRKEWEIGPRGHALRSLALYNERVFGDQPGERGTLLARWPQR